MGSDSHEDEDGCRTWRGAAAWELYFGRDTEDSSTESGRGKIVAKIEEFFATTGRKFLADIGKNKTGFQVNFGEFVELCPVKGISKAIVEAPQDALSCIGLAASRALENSGRSNELDFSPAAKLWPRIHGFGKLSKLKDLNSTTLGSFVALRGNVVRVSNVRQQCGKCGVEFRQEFEDCKFKIPIECKEAPRCRSRVFQPVRASATTIDWQKLRVQETCKDDVREIGRIPRTIDAELGDDLIDSTVPGDYVTLCGIAKTINVESGDAQGRAKTRSLFHLYIDVNSLQVDRKSNKAGSNSDEGDDSLEKDHQAFEEIRRDRDPFALLIHSLCPSIFGNEIVKAGLLLTLLGGSQKVGTTDVHIRPDIHCLVVGDPGLGKSQLLKATANIASRGVYICGNTSTTSGLTVTVVKEQGSNDFSLEAGALVLGDLGICCIDEFDKMGNEHQALLEAMEQQTVSIAKAGILCNLSARTSVIAAANPKGGHYDRSKTVCENLKVALPLLSRFDLVFILLDHPDEARDRVISDHVISWSKRQVRTTPKSRTVAGPVPAVPAQRVRGAKSSIEETASTSLVEKLRTSGYDDPIPTSLLRRYLAYARLHVHPVSVYPHRGDLAAPRIASDRFLASFPNGSFTAHNKVLADGAKRVLQKFYLTLRRGARDQALDVMPVTTRQLESLIRLVEARAKAEHRQIATEQDAIDVVEVMKASMLDTFSDEHGRIDLGRASGMSRGRDAKRFVMALHAEAEKSGRDVFTMTELRRVAQNLEMNLVMFDEFIEMINHQNLLLKRNRCYQLQGTTFA